MSHETLLQTLLHLLDTQWFWRCACQEGVLPVERLTADQFATMRSLRAYWREEDRQLIAYVESLPETALDQPVQYQWPRARPRSKTLWHLIFHIVTHGTHHRGEIGL